MTTDHLDPQPTPTPGSGDVWRDVTHYLRWLVTATAILFFLLGLACGIAAAVGASHVQ